MLHSSLASTVHVRLANYADPDDAKAVVTMLDAYAQDPMGGGHALPAHAREQLVPALAARPFAFSVLAFAGTQQGSEAVGLANCFEGFSTFACKPLVNVHDLAVMPGHRGLGVGAALLAFVEGIARERGACKLTLEVLQGNAKAMRLYERMGFASYQLDPQMGHAQMMQRWLR
ncbi:GNAT family N-acetyltransferase [Variovorax sp. HJSM1_2]|uniref:GNAT family N-acetyltransferase n=1 Tax=Variovorax sp. HJSM1_2 TaxID=3366263 RepID=UPI003BD5B423